MGIQGLLPFLKKIHEPVNVSKYSGCTVAIDSYCWLHKGAFSCAEKLALGEKTDQYVYYCMKFINYLLSKNIKPVMVFDGCHLPSKKAVETSRRERRDLNRKKAAQFLREGRRAEARDCLQKCIDISPQMALELMNVCRDKGVDCIVAPYEADAQLAYLNKIGVAQVIITEDSDLLLFGCERVIFKMDHAGNGILIEQKRLNEVLDIPSTQYTFEKFRYSCILSGCDYLPSLSGIGLVKATKVFKVARQADIRQLLKKLSTYLKMNISVPDEYIEGFVAADHTFLYQLVYDPLCRRLVPLCPYPPDLGPSDLPYAGAQLPQSKALQIALGNINIYSGEKFADFNPDIFIPKYVKKCPDMLHMRSIWERSYRIRAIIPVQETPVERPNLRGQEVQMKTTVRRQSPRKRVREEDNPRDVKTNSELSQLYSEASPTTKRLKSDIDDDLQRFMFSAQKQDLEDSAEDPIDPDPVETQTPARSGHNPQFFNSLSQAHPSVEVSREQEEEEEKENSPVSEPLLKSPGKNVFASRSPSKKSRFNLNATKPVEVKSRFFTSSMKSACKPEPVENSSSVFCTSSVSTFLTPPTSGDSKTGVYKPVHSNSANMYNTRGSTSPSTKTSPSSIQSVARKFSFDSSKKHTPSPRSAFNWSKFKFAKSSNSENSSLRVKDSLIKNESNDNVIIKGGNSDVPNVLSKDTLSPLESQSPVREMTTESEERYPYSIDSMCLENEESQQDASQSEQSENSSQRMSDNTPTQLNSSHEYCDGGNKRQPKGLSLYFKGNVKSSTVDDVQSSDERNIDVLKETDTNSATPHILIDDSDEDAIKVTVTSSQLSTRAQGSTKPGCRVSGLSRRSKKTKSKSTVADGKQKSLKDMFNNYSYNKSSLPKLGQNVS